jgi:AraC-like DNA-binding protein
MDTTGSEWVMLNKETGQEIECDVFLKTRSHHHWERTCVNTLAAFIECGGSASSDIIAYILRNKDSTNRLIGSYDKVAAETGAGKSSVMRVFKAMMKKNLMRKEQNGVYIIHGDVARYGSKARGAAIAAIWDAAN